MNSKRILCRLLTLIQNYLLVLVLMLMFSYIWYSVYSHIIPLPFWYRGNILLVVIYGVVILLLQFIHSSQKLSFKRSSDVIFGNLLALFNANIVIYLQTSLIARSFIYVPPFIAMSLVQSLFIIFWAFTNKALFIRLCPPRKMLMIIGRKEGQLLKLKMDFDPHQFDIHEVIYTDEDLKDILQTIKSYSEVIISDVPSHYRNEILKECSRLEIRTFMTPKISDIIIRSAENILLYDTPLLMAKGQSLTFEQRLIKRTFDIVSSFLAIIILSPVFLIITMLIFAHDQGPIIYTQDRYTLHGKVFKIYKFRSMVVDSEKKGAQLASKNDSRITPIGHFIRRTHLDELPQLFNILKGDMSVVGPRPERPEIAKEYELIIPEFAHRLKVKAGLSGYAQVYGQYNTTPYDKLKHDIFYIENYSFWLDLNIIFLTLKIMFVPEKSEGVDENQITAIVDIDEVMDIKIDKNID